MKMLRIRRKSDKDIKLLTTINIRVTVGALNFQHHLYVELISVL